MRILLGRRHHDAVRHEQHPPPDPTGPIGKPREIVGGEGQPRGRLRVDPGETLAIKVHPVPRREGFEDGLGAPGDLADLGGDVGQHPDGRRQLEALVKQLHGHMRDVVAPEHHGEHVERDGLARAPSP